MKIEGYYDKKRFWHFPTDWICLGESFIKKTACFYNGDTVFYIDTSDGINEDLGIDEGVWRINEIINDKRRGGKPFIMFKTSYSEVHSRKLKDFARENSGDVLPFFLWSYYGEFNYLIKNRKSFLEIKRNTPKEYDIGFIASLNSYPYPDGCGNLLRIDTRQILFDKLKNSGLKFFYKEKMSFDDYIKASFKCKLVLNVPGIGEYSGRMLEAWALGQALVCRKNTYDNAFSYKSRVLDIDFNTDGWEEVLKKGVENYEYWENCSKEYWKEVYENPDVMFDYIKDKI